MDQAEINRLCQSPGVEGALWRLIRTWDPDKVVLWAMEERKKGADPEMVIHCVAEVMSGAAFSLANLLGGDKRGAMLGDNGLLGQLRTMVAHKLDVVGGIHQVVNRPVQAKAADVMTNAIAGELPRRGVFKQ